MSYVIYPTCTNDDIRKKEIDSASPFSRKDIYPQEGNDACHICVPGKRVVANGNRFDNVFAGDDK